MNIIVRMQKKLWKLFISEKFSKCTKGICIDEYKKIFGHRLY